MGKVTAPDNMVLTTRNLRFTHEQPRSLGTIRHEPMVERRGPGRRLMLAPDSDQSTNPVLSMLASSNAGLVCSAGATSSAKCLRPCPGSKAQLPPRAVLTFLVGGRV